MQPHSRHSVLQIVKDSTLKTSQCFNWVALPEQKQFSMVEDMHDALGLSQNKNDV